VVPVPGDPQDNPRPSTPQFRPHSDSSTVIALTFPPFPTRFLVLHTVFHRNRPKLRQPSCAKGKAPSSVGPEKEVKKRSRYPMKKEIDHGLEDQRQPRDPMCRRLANGTLFHLWVIGITRLNSGKNPD
jgi:hypothetical protein